MSDAVFVDTSALYAALDRDDEHHVDAAATWRLLLDHMAEGLACRTHTGVIIELSALVQRRLGVPALRTLHHEVLPILDVVWVGESLHQRAVSALLAADRRDISLVDWTSFEVMRDGGITHVFAFDQDFEAQGFKYWRP